MNYILVITLDNVFNVSNVQKRGNNIMMFPNDRIIRQENFSMESKFYHKPIVENQNYPLTENKSSFQNSKNPKNYEILNISENLGVYKMF